MTTATPQKKYLTWIINTKFSRGPCMLNKRIKMYIGKIYVAMWICDIALDTVVI